MGEIFIEVPGGSKLKPQWSSAGVLESLEFLSDTESEYKRTFLSLNDAGIPKHGVPSESDTFAANMLDLARHVLLTKKAVIASVLLQNEK